MVCRSNAFVINSMQLIAASVSWKAKTLVWFGTSFSPLAENENESIFLSLASFFLFLWIFSDKIIYVFLFLPKTFCHVQSYGKGTLCPESLKSVPNITSIWRLSRVWFCHARKASSRSTRPLSTSTTSSTPSATCSTCPVTNWISRYWEFKYSRTRSHPSVALTYLAICYLRLEVSR